MGKHLIIIQWEFSQTSDGEGKMRQDEEPELFHMETLRPIFAAVIVWEDI